VTVTTMADECQIVTAFLLNTCRRPRKCDVQAPTMQCAVEAAEHPTDDEEVERILLVTGSVAEFYIEPMLLPDYCLK